jgi:hypothetical protein
VTLVSVAPLAEAALLAILRGSPDFVGVSVLDAPVTPETASAEVFYVDSIEFDQSWRGGIRPASRNDVFTIVAAFLIRRAAAPGDVKARAWTLLSALQAAIAADWTLGNVLNQSCEVAGGAVAPYPAGLDGAWEVRVDVRIDCDHILP